MTFGRRKRFLLGWLSLAAPIPLPFNGVLTWPGYAAYAVVVVAFLFRARRDPGGWLPSWAMNVLAAAYLPYFVFDLRFLSHGRLVAAVTHLLLFTVLVKLFALRRERDKWQTAIAVFFLFLTSMATSVHPAIALYLVGFLGLALLVFARFAQLHVAAGFTAAEDDSGPFVGIPLVRFLGLSVVATLLLAGPLFVLMPRVRNPIVSGTGGGLGPTEAVTGFSEGVTLDTIGTIRTSREVAMRLRYRDAPPPGHEMRFKGGAYATYLNGAWRPDRSGREWSRGRWGTVLRLAPGRPSAWVEVFLRPITGTALMVPVDAMTVEQEQLGMALVLDDAGVVRRIGGSSGTLEYRVGLAGSGVGGAAPDPPAPARAAALPASREEGFSPATLDAEVVSPRIAALAAEVAGEGTPEEQARRIERHLMTEYDYSLEFLGRSTRADPVEAFLFDRREGHCEYFATAMALMLRARGIPSRLATGFLGAEYNRLEDYYVVRQANAHAWVEAYLPESGWTTFDPTPPSGRPLGSRGGLGNVLGQAWDYVLFRWDRYVLTYGFNDQMQFLASAYGFWRDLASIFGGEEEDLLADAAAPWAEADPEAAVEEAPAGGAGWRGEAVGVVALLALLGALVAVHRARRPLSGADAYRRLRRIAGEAGLPVRDTDPPLGFAHRLAWRFPQAGAAGGELVALYVKESYGGEALADADAARLQDALSQVVQVLRKAG